MYFCVYRTDHAQDFATIVNKTIEDLSRINLASGLDANFLYSEEGIRDQQKRTDEEAVQRLEMEEAHKKNGPSSLTVTKPSSGKAALMPKAASVNNVAPRLTHRRSSSFDDKEEEGLIEGKVKPASSHTSITTIPPVNPPSKKTSSSLRSV